ncbi:MULTISPECIES: NUDIX domain-containing protein [unclassified Halomonas]|uniref:NUDIX domain-containing protein n=1 Tax=unclassified Halomonas TaxID=2609666 RepID=UPI0021E4A13B|nr:MULTISPECIES: NUDIX domain-containing protein [unclassified Halomonas]UYG00967.1 NUDIX domain-containing protein [Halomonas sp. GD1P12]WNL41293.1 NUDIX domain-containing protein [Halomonas sp. PAMB 3264]
MKRIHTTAACVIERDGRYLMVEEERGGPHTLFNQPAGHIEPGEGPMAAILREVEEETAWRVRLSHYLGLEVFHTPEKTFHSHGFIATPEVWLATPLDPDILATHWLTFDEVRQLATNERVRSPLVIKRLEAARAGRVYPLAIISE